MLHFVRKIVANFACLPLCANQLVYYVFLELFLWKRPPATMEQDATRAVRVQQNTQVIGWWAKRASTHNQAPEGRAELQLYHF